MEEVSKRHYYIFHSSLTNTPIDSAKEWLVSVYKVGRKVPCWMLAFIRAVTVLFPSFDSSLFTKVKQDSLSENFLNHWRVVFPLWTISFLDQFPSLPPQIIYFCCNRWFPWGSFCSSVKSSKWMKVIASLGRALKRWWAGEVQHPSLPQLPEAQLTQLWSSDLLVECKTCGQ